MTFFGIGPWAALGLLAVMAGALYALHHLRVRPSVQRVPTLLFWRQAIEESTARHLFQRFRHPRTFALLTLLAAVIILALADPTVGADTRPHHVVVIDTSGAAQVMRDGATALETMRLAALSWLDGVPLRDRVALVAGGRVVAGFEAPRPEVRARLEALPAGTVARVARSLGVADTLARGRDRAHVIAFAVSPRPASVDTAAVEWVAFTIAPTGRAITGVTFGERLRVRVDAHAADAARRLVVTTRDGEERAAVEVPAVDTAVGRWFEVPGVNGDGTEIVVRLDPTDDTPHDDLIRYRLPESTARAVDVAAELAAVRLLVDADDRLTIAEDAGRAGLAVRVDSGGATIAGGTRVRPTGATLVDAAASSRVPRLERDIVSLAPGAGRALLLAGDGVLARLDRAATPPRLVLAADLFGGDGAARFLRRAWAADWLAGTLRTAAGAGDGAIVVRVDTDTAAVIARTESGTRELRRIAVRPSDAPFVGGAPVRFAFAGAPLPAAVARDGTASAAPPGGWRWWEWLVLTAFALALVDAALQLRRRIP